MFRNIPGISASSQRGAGCKGNGHRHRSRSPALVQARSGSCQFLPRGPLALKAAGRSDQISHLGLNAREAVPQDVAPHPSSADVTALPLLFVGFVLGSKDLNIGIGIFVPTIVTGS